ncbi:Acetolactate synthase large subunit thiamine pyrophosphate-requiring enzyme [Halanaeroarchaeum sp. HSR-CO]|uniref:surface glycoprotein n=1 Tax=Halanaeroarchaeum sp. HSR-CO TaxID=2866382 RepID=UPI00217D618B|nr:surface glycoprotein [Halanaeroarchaeum sp. HSR-CO]UWG47046.1 Acetolactate synthase large subunit thiamine pyrophosphate-requiring enzyme [Halanaeroarchaeum sp. HSR-CO]
MKGRAITLSALLVLSMIGGVVAISGTAAAGPPGFVTTGSGVSDETVDPSNPPKDKLPEQAQGNPGGDTGDTGPPGQTGPPGNSGQGGPPAHALEKMPDHARENVMASRSTMEIQWGSTSSGSPALVVTDDQVSESGEVAIPVEAFEETMGGVPLTARGVHESGERWTAEIEQSDGYATFEIPHFSTNTVTFSGTVQIGDTMVDGSTISYDLNSLDAASDPTIQLTGKTNTEQLSKTYSLLDGGSQSFTVGGNQPTDLTLELTGTEYSRTEENSTGMYVNHDMYDSLVDETKTGVMYEATESETYEAAIDWYISIEQSGQGDTFIDAKVYYRTYDASADSYSSWTEIKHLSDNTLDAGGSRSGTYTTSLDLDAGDRVEGKSEVYYGDGGDDYNWGKAKVGPSNYTVTNPSGEVSGSIAGEAYSSPTLSVGETWNTTVSGVSTGDHSIDASSSNGGSVDVNIEGTEKTQTQDPGVELNGQTVSHSGTLADGETTTLTLNQSALQEGTNTVNVSMPSLSADAPAMQVGVDYSHDAMDDQNVSYEAEKFSERYEVSKTYASDRGDPTLTLPFADEAVSIRQAEYRINGGDWQTTDNWVVSNTTGTIHLPDAAAGDTYEVRANASKVAVDNGAIRVLEATATADSLDSKIEITEHRPDFSLDVSGIDDERMVYAADQSWGEPDSHVLIDANGNQKLRLPEAGPGSTTHIRDLPMWATTENDVEISIEDGSVPRFEVRPGSTEGDAVEIEYRDTVSGQAYALQKPDASDPTAVDTAESPVYFSTIDSLATYEIVETTLDGGATQPIGPIESDSGSPSPILLLVGIVGALGGLLLIARGLGGSSRTGRSSSRSLSFRGYSLSLPSLPSLPTSSRTEQTSRLVVIGGMVIIGIVALELATPDSLYQTALTAAAMSASALQELLTIAMGVGALLGIWLLDQRTAESIPRWLMGVAAVVTVVYMLETIQPGVLLGPASEGFETISPLFWLVLLGGGSYFVYGYIQAKRAPDTTVTLDLGDRR